MSQFSDLLFETRVAAESFADYISGGRLRLGVTGLSRSGKTVFITALVHQLTRALAAGTGRQTNLPVFRVLSEGRLESAYLDPQPDYNVPRFAYEEHLGALTGLDRHWPHSTRRISELRVTLEYKRKGASMFARSGPGRLDIDIVDYPGEWLLDLPLLGKSYAEWSRETLEASSAAARASIAADWRGANALVDPLARIDEPTAQRLASLFTQYLRHAKTDRYALSTLPPGRFLMPGDLEGSPMLTFAPLAVEEGAELPRRSLAAEMERRYEAYKAQIVKPFFRDHFARLDRQIVLVDTLAALNSGPAAVRDLETALTEVLTAFRTGRSSLFSAIFRPKIDKILFAATKADHLHHTSHDRLEGILRLLTSRAIKRAEGVGAKIDVIALAAVRATREAMVRHEDEMLSAIVGTPIAGERIGLDAFDGVAEGAIFPGELPADPRLVFRGDALAVAEEEADFRFLKFRPPVAQLAKDSEALPLPHIRLDRAMEFLLGDRLD
ncbi:YcjX family protein [Methylocystis heyeri]|uniref:YcjX family protein n=1 Tax=Methylocystis heyeri TaxID=391905 RepID=A0A6B8KF81_9HYPH|nr:YcjX family protein [Methylocystis heyeri]QGM46309.1 YcjX family protein [Methylocystis heyeri]